MSSEIPRITAETETVDTDLDQEPIVPPSGRVLDEQAAAEYGEEVAAQAAARRQGRQSATRSRARWRQVSARVPPELRAAVDAIAEHDGVQPADVVRSALEEYVLAHS